MANIMFWITFQIVAVVAVSFATAFGFIWLLASATGLSWDEVNEILDRPF